MKMLVFVAGADRHADWMLDLGDHLCHFSRLSEEHPCMVYSSGETAWLLPQLQGDNSGTKLSGYIKGIQPAVRGGLVRYKDFAVPSLPSQPTAAGIRPGAADLLAMSVPAELGVHNTGHDLTGLSALWEYLNGRISLCIPGAIVLAGWDPLPYGQMGKGPASPKLDCLFVIVSIEELDIMINLLYFSDQTLPRLLVGGELRPLMHATAATMIMYYPEREKANEMSKVLHFMRNAVTKIAAPDQDLHTELCKWAKLIRTQFDADNLRLTAKKEHGGHEQVH